MKPETISELVTEYRKSLERRVEAGRASQNSLVAVDSRFKSIIEPTLGGKRLRSITPSHAEQWHSTASKAGGHRPVAVNRAAEILRASWNLAERMGWVGLGTNPFRFLGHYKNQEKERARVLNNDELKRLTDELDRAMASGPEPERLGAAAIRLLMETGCRREEILGLSVGETKADHLELTQTKTGRKTVYLSKAAREILDRLPAPTGPKVFAGASWRGLWERTRKKVGLADVTLHDLRRTYSTRLAEAGVPAEDVARLLGQKTVRVNIDHYRQIGTARLQALAETAALALEAGRTTNGNTNNERSWHGNEPEQEAQQRGPGDPGTREPAGRTGTGVGPERNLGTGDPPGDGAGAGGEDPRVGEDDVARADREADPRGPQPGHDRVADERRRGGERFVREDASMVAGRQAARDGIRRDACPYRIGDDRRKKWLVGHIDETVTLKRKRYDNGIRKAAAGR